MTIQEKVKTVAQKFTKVNYEFMNWAQLNERVDDVVSKPTICYILPASGTLHASHSASLWKDSPTTQIAFLTPTDFDFDGAENDDKVEVMKELAKQFIRALNESGYFEMIDGEDVPYQIPYDTTDDNLTGVIITITLQELEYKKICQINYNFGCFD